MRIEKISPPSRSGGTWVLALENGKTLSVCEQEMVDFSLYSGMELEDETLSALRAAGKYSSLKNRAVSMLSRGPRSEKEVQKKLLHYGASEFQAEEISAWLISLGLLNDAVYAQTIARHYSAKGYGVYKIKDELYRRQVPKDYWEDALSAMEPSDEFIDEYLARHLAHVDWHDRSDRKAIKKATDALARRGFSWSEISEGIDRLRITED